MYKSLKIMAAVTLIGLAFAGTAQADALDRILQAKKIRIAIDLGTAPDGLTDANMQPAGRDVDVGRALARDLGVEMEIVNTTGPTRVPLLQTNKADLVISTLSVTAERAKIIDFSMPYAVLESVVAALKNIPIKDYGDLVGKSVAVTRGTTQDTDLTRDAKGAEIVRYDDDNTMLTAAATGQSDIVSTSVALINTINTKNPNRQFEPKFLQRNFMTAMGIRKGEPRLLERINAWIRINLKNGYLNGLQKKYHGSDLPAEVLDAG